MDDMHISHSAGTPRPVIKEGILAALALRPLTRAVLMHSSCCGGQPNCTRMRVLHQPCHYASQTESRHACRPFPLFTAEHWTAQPPLCKIGRSQHACCRVMMQRKLQEVLVQGHSKGARAPAGLRGSAAPGRRQRQRLRRTPQKRVGSCWRTSGSPSGGRNLRTQAKPNPQYTPHPPGPASTLIPVTPQHEAPAA